MEINPPPKPVKAKSTIRKKGIEGVSEFPIHLTIEFDQLLRSFNYTYQAKEKDVMLNKNITGPTYWMVIDATYFPKNSDYQSQKISSFRKKSVLNKNGCFPPTKDSLEEEKFILMMRRLASEELNTLNIAQIRSTSIINVISHLQSWVKAHEERLDERFKSIQQKLKTDNLKKEEQLKSFEIPLINSSRLFIYYLFEKNIVEDLVEKFRKKEEEPKCELCFSREKTIQCKSCQLNVHVLCYPKLPRDYPLADFICNNCEKNIPNDAQCSLCPCKGGYFLDLNQDFQQFQYDLAKGESSLKFTISKKATAARKKGYIHLSCFVLHPECQYNAQSGLVEGLHLIDRRKQRNICSICGNMLGLTIPCYNESCRRSFHPECAKRNNLSINVIKANNKTLLEIYCERHKRPESFEIFMQSSSNKIKELRKFFEFLQNQMKRLGANPHSNKPKKTSKCEQNLKCDLCLICGQINDYERSIFNCTKCYGWRHTDCLDVCPLCDFR